MKRLQQKCVIVSVGLHLLLLGILFIGPGFLSPKTSTETMPPLDFVPWRTVDKLVSGGGNPEAKPLPAVQPPAPVTQPPPAAAPPVVLPTAPPVAKPLPPIEEPKPQPVLRRSEPKPDPEPEKPEKPIKTELPKITKPDPDSLETKTEEKPRRPQISTDVVTRTPDSRKQAKARAEEKARELAQEQAREEARQWAEARRRVAEKVGQTVTEIGNGLSSGTSIKLHGPGGGGIPYANFLQEVQSVYERAWIVPDGVTDNEATAVVTVTIARDGTVILARIQRSSGNRLVDRSVQATLDRVKFAARLPEDAKENERTVTINFNVKAKRGLG